MNCQNPPWYSSLKSTAIFYPHIYAFWMDPFLLIFPSQICSILPSLPCMPHSLPIMPLLSDTLQSHKHYKSSNSTLCLFFLPFPLSSVQTLFPSLCSQTEPTYKWQIALRSITSIFLCFSHHVFPYNLYFKLQNWLIKKEQNRSQTTFHITYQLLYISAPRCHLHTVYY